MPICKKKTTIGANLQLVYNITIAHTIIKLTVFRHLQYIPQKNFRAFVLIALMKILIKICHYFQAFFFSLFQKNSIKIYLPKCHNIHNF